MRLYDMITETTEHEQALQRLSNEAGPKLLKEFISIIENNYGESINSLGLDEGQVMSEYVGKLGNFVEDWGQYSALPEEFKFLKVYLTTAPIEDAHAGVFTRGGWSIALTVEHTEITYKNISTMVHELRHALDYIIDKRFVNPTADGVPKPPHDPAWAEKHPDKDPWAQQHSRHTAYNDEWKHQTTAYHGSSHEINARVSQAMELIDRVLSDGRLPIKNNNDIKQLVYVAMMKNNLFILFQQNTGPAPVTISPVKRPYKLPLDNPGFRQVYKRLFLLAKEKLTAERGSREQ